MDKSETIKDLVAALIKAKAKFTPLKKSRTATVKMKNGGYYSYNYADLADILTMVTPPLADQGLVIIQPVTVTDGQILIFTELMHTTGQWLSTELPLPNIATGNMNAIQQIGSVITYGRRYAIESLLGIASEEDTDGKGGEGERQTEAQKKAAAEKDRKTKADQPPPQEITEKKTDQDKAPERFRQYIVADIVELLKNEQFLDEDRALVKATIETTKTNIALEAVLSVWESKLNTLKNDSADIISEKPTEENSEEDPSDPVRQIIIDEIDGILKHEKFTGKDRATVKSIVIKTKTNAALEALRDRWSSNLNRLIEGFIDDEPRQKLSDEQMADLEKTADQGWFENDIEKAKAASEKKAMEQDIY